MQSLQHTYRKDSQKCQPENSWYTGWDLNNVSETQHNFHKLFAIGSVPNCTERKCVQTVLETSRSHATRCSASLKPWHPLETHTACKLFDLNATIAVRAVAHRKKREQ